MSKKLIMILFLLLAIVIAVTVFSTNISAEGWLQCYCQSTECMQELDNACSGGSMDFAGWDAIYAKCFGSDCYTWYIVHCDGADNTSYHTYVSCDDPCDNWCDGGW